jgi:hypothetical protein
VRLGCDGWDHGPGAAVYSVIVLRPCEGPKSCTAVVRGGGSECSTRVGEVTLQALTGRCVVTMPAVDMANATVVGMAARCEVMRSLRLP